jgi:hypothetical protein
LQPNLDLDIIVKNRHLLQESSTNDSSNNTPQVMNEKNNSTFITIENVDVTSKNPFKQEKI